MKKGACMPFPISQHCGSVVFVDDDRQYLSVIQSIFSSKWNVKTFLAVDEFLQFLAGKAAVSSDMDAYQRSAVGRWKKNGSVPVEVLRYWNAFPERYSIPKVVVIDNHMPEVTGLAALQKCSAWRGKRVLLSGVADELLVTKAFNEGRLDYYIPKQNSKLMKEIGSCLSLMLEAHDNDCLNLWTPWNLSMRQEYSLLLREAEIAQALFNFVGIDHEHVAMGDPFGVLALGFDGHLKWLQLETTETLDEAAEIALVAGATKEDAVAIRAGSLLSDARIKKAFGIAIPAVAAVPTFKIRVPNMNSTVYGASFEVNVPGAPPPQLCYTAWKERQQF
jgi:CheY-like chemotaxis protein